MESGILAFLGYVFIIFILVTAFIVYLVRDTNVVNIEIQRMIESDTQLKDCFDTERIIRREQAKFTTYGFPEDSIEYHGYNRL